MDILLCGYGKPTIAEAAAIVEYSIGICRRQAKRHLFYPKFIVHRSPPVSDYYYKFTMMLAPRHSAWVVDHSGLVPRYTSGVSTAIYSVDAAPQSHILLASRALAGLGSGGGGGSFLVYYGQILMFGKEHPFEKYNGTSTQNTKTVTYT